MTTGLSINRLVRVTVNLTQAAAAQRGFGTALVVGDSDVINGSERIRSYIDLESVASDFGTTAPEYYAAQLYYSQTPRPLDLQIGRWVRTASSAILAGGILTTAEQAMANWTAITNGTFTISVDGTSQDVTLLDFSLETNLNGVASEINTVLTGATASWNGSKFIITSTSTGSTATLSYATAQGTGTDISALLKLTSAISTAPVNGYDAETPVEAVAVLADVSNAWYGCAFAASVMPTDDQSVAVAQLIEGLTVSRIFGVTTGNTLVLESSVTNDIASQLRDLKYNRSCVQYSQNAYAIFSLFGRAFSVDFNANRSTIILMYKQEPGVIFESLTENQAQTLKAKRCNVFVEYENNTAIIQYGVMSGDTFFDTRHGLDWFANALQTALYNLLYTSKTKIPQTDSGQNQLVSTVASVCDSAVNNGLVAAGTWNATGFGQLQNGDFLPTGYYIYTAPMASQDQAAREERIAPVIQTAIKLAGGIQEIDCVVDVNR